jgi:hypothetical protein
MEPVMNKMIFVNLPLAELAASKRFYEGFATRRRGVAALLLATLWQGGFALAAETGAPPAKPPTAPAGQY